jgi:hypothetical protein
VRKRSSSRAQANATSSASTPEDAEAARSDRLHPSVHGARREGSRSQTRMGRGQPLRHRPSPRPYRHPRRRPRGPRAAPRPRLHLQRPAVAQELATEELGPLLAAPADAGELKARSEELAGRAWKHPTTGESIRFAFKTIERWRAGSPKRFGPRPTRVSKPLPFGRPVPLKRPTKLAVAADAAAFAGADADDERGTGHVRYRSGEGSPYWMKLAQ